MWEACPGRLRAETEQRPEDEAVERVATGARVEREGVRARVLGTAVAVEQRTCVGAQHCHITCQRCGSDRGEEYQGESISHCPWGARV